MNRFTRSPLLGLLAPLALALLLPSACAQPAADQEEPARVRVATAELGPIAERLEFPGRLVPPADRDATLAPQVAGRLVAVEVREGEEVRRGELLAQVDDAALRASLRAAQADLERAKSEEHAKQRAADVTRSLLDKGIASVEERNADDAAAAAATSSRVAAEAALAAAERQLGWSRLAAPFDGVVVQVFRHAGETVDGSAATPVVRLAGRERTEVEAQATADDLARLKPDTKCEVGAGERTVAAHLIRVAGAVDPTSGLGEIRAALDEPSPLPLFAAVRLAVVVTSYPQAVLVPLAAVRRGESGTDEVLVVEGSTAHVRAVRVGLRNAAQAQIVEGVAAGDKRVAEPLGLADGAKIEALAAPGSH